MAVFDELNRRKRIEDPEARKAEDLKRSDKKKARGFRASSISLRSFKIASGVVVALVAIVTVSVIGYFAYQAILLYIGG